MVDTALRLLNEVGLDGLTLRRIAKALNVQAPALYWHFKNKQELIDEMATEMFRRMTEPLLADQGAAGGADPFGGTWRDVLIHGCSLVRRELLGYRDGGKVFSGTRMTDGGYAAPMEYLLGRFVEAGFSLSEAARAWWTAYNFTIGVVIEEQSVYPEPGPPERRRPQDRDPAYDLTEREERLAADFPLAARAGREYFGEMDRGFLAGLEIIVAGIAAMREADRGTGEAR